MIKKIKAKSSDNRLWVVSNKYTTRKEMEEYYGKDSGYNIEDFQEIEISIIRKNNKLGKESYGWNGFDKIILFDHCIGSPSKEEMNWCKKVSEIVADALNSAKL